MLFPKSPSLPLHHAGTRRDFRPLLAVMSAIVVPFASLSWVSGHHHHAHGPRAGSHRSTSRHSASTSAASFDGRCHSQSGSGNLSPTTLGSYDHVMVGAPNRLAASSNPGYEGRCAIRVSLQPGDGGDPATDRDEISGTRTLWRSGQDVWYSIAFMLGDAQPAPPPGGWMLIHQFFAQDISAGISGGSPPFAVEITTHGTIDVDVRGGSKASAGDAAPRDSEYQVAPATPGVWHTLLIHIDWSTGPDGLVQVWHTTGDVAFPATPRVDAAGPNVLTVAGHALPVYAETGIYRSHATTRQVVLYAGLTAASSMTGALRTLGSPAAAP